MTLTATDIARIRAVQMWKEKFHEADRRLEIAEKAALACPKPLVWTDETPKKDGWYWLRDSEGSQTIMNIKMPFLSAWYRKGQWSGPIPEPVEPTE